MTDSSLSLSQTPPLFVPLRYMLTAPLFAIAAAILIVIYPDALQDRWSPAMLSVTHLLVLGFAVMVMFGAVQQLIPVLAGVSLGHPQLISVSLYIGLTLGILCLCGGLLSGHALLMLLALVLLSATVLAFLVIMMSALLRSAANLNSILGIRLALLSLLASVAVGVYLAAGHGLPGVSLARNLTSLHVAWGLLGWIGLLVMAVSYQVVPMFQITPKYPKVIVRWLAPFVFASLLLWSLFEFVWYRALSGTWISVLTQFGVGVGLLTFAVVTLRLQQQRRRKLPDVTMDFFRVALVAMILAVFVWSLPPDWRNLEILIGELMIVGFAMSVISGMLYKIVPFLIWLHLTNEADMSTRQAPIPNMKQIIAEGHSRWQFRLHLAAVLMVMAATFANETIARLAALLFLGSNLYLLRNLVSGVLVYRKHRKITEDRYDTGTGPSHP